jgi:hypothetical protein
VNKAIQKALRWLINSSIVPGRTLGPHAPSRGHEDRTPDGKRVNHMGFPLDPKPDKAGEQKEPLLAKIKKVTFHDCGAEHDAYNASNDHLGLLANCKPSPTT